MMEPESELAENSHKDHPPHLLDERFYVHANQPCNMGGIPNPEGKAAGVGVCGDSIEIYLSIQNQVIENIGQIPHGCIYTVACGSAVGDDTVGASETVMLYCCASETP